MRLIDADLLKANVNNWYALVNEWGQTRMTLGHDDIIAKIDNVPTVDVLDKISTEIQMMADDEWNKQVGASKGLEEALEIIDKYREGEMDHGHPKGYRHRQMV